MIISITSVLLNVILNISLSRYFGIGGLAMATSISAILAAMLLSITLRMKIGCLGLKGAAASFLRISLASVTMGVVVRGAWTYLVRRLGQYSALMVSICIGVLVYGILVYLLKVQEAERALGAFWRKYREARSAISNRN